MNLWEGYPPPFLSAEDKREIAEKRTPITITRCEKVDSQYGPRWVLTIDVNGLSYRMSLAANEARDEFLSRVQTVLETGQHVPCRLRLVTGKGRQPFYIFEPPLDFA